jgi:hypothetical protein
MNPSTPVRDWDFGAFQAGYAGSNPVARPGEAQVGGCWAPSLLPAVAGERPSSDATMGQAEDLAAV